MIDSIIHSAPQKNSHSIDCWVILRLRFMSNGRTGRRCASNCCTNTLQSWNSNDTRLIWLYYIQNNKRLVVLMQGFWDFFLSPTRYRSEWTEPRYLLSSARRFEGYILLPRKASRSDGLYHPWWWEPAVNRAFEYRMCSWEGCQTPPGNFLSFVCVLVGVRPRSDAWKLFKFRSRQRYINIGSFLELDHPSPGCHSALARKLRLRHWL
jgi:hypothetical protein